MVSIQTNYIDKYNSAEINPDSPEFNKDELYSDLGEIKSSDVANITINGVTYDNSNKRISIGNNAFIVAPVYLIEDNHLLVSNFYLTVHAKDGIVTVKTETDAFEVTLEGLDGGDTLALNKAIPAFTQEGRINEVTVDGSTITQVSNSGNHGLAVMLEADGQLLNDADLICYSLLSNGNIGMTTPNAIDGEMYTYGAYLKYTGADYTAEDATTITSVRTLFVPGKGSIELTFVLEAQEYIA